MPRRTAALAAQTRSDLIEAGTRHFTHHSFSDTSLEDLVRDLGVTRGALYHHFGSKRGLFEAVIEREFSRLQRRILAAADQERDGWDRLGAGCRAFLAAAADPAFRRIALMDGPAVLGWSAWKEHDDQAIESTLAPSLRRMAAAKLIATDDTPALTQAIAGAMKGLALWIAADPDPAQALARAEAIVEDLLRGLRGG